MNVNTNALKKLARGVLVAGLMMAGVASTWAANPANPNKVLKTVFPAAETGFDPGYIHDRYSAKITDLELNSHPDRIQIFFP
jgi:oligopeptide transport system substrate-binding protein